MYACMYVCVYVRIYRYKEHPMAVKAGLLRVEALGKPRS
jgi:hypothetical protein